MPMVLSELNNNGYEDWEGFLFVRLENVEEIVILEEAHRAVSYLQVVSTDAFCNALEEAGNQWLNTLNLAHLNNLLELS